MKLFLHSLSVDPEAVFAKKSNPVKTDPKSAGVEGGGTYIYHTLVLNTVTKFSCFQYVNLFYWCAHSPGS